ncbi:hypothetical protein TI39_contig1258g00001, partial [Zymoseptoria brevis]
MKLSILLLSMASSSMAWWFCYNYDGGDGVCQGENGDRGTQPCWPDFKCHVVSPSTPAGNG